MKPSETELIATLANQLEPTPAYRKPRTLLALWILGCAVYLSIIAWQSPGYHPVFFGPHSWPSKVSWALLALTFLCSSTGSIVAGVPGSGSVRGWLISSWTLISLWAVWLVLRHFIEPSGFELSIRLPHHGDIKCAYETFYWGVGPLAALYGVLRGLAPVQIGRAGSLWWLAAFSASGFLIEIFCDDESVFHQLYGHWLLVAALGFIGFRVGRALLRW